MMQEQKMEKIKADLMNEMQKMMQSSSGRPMLVPPYSPMPCKCSSCPLMQQHHAPAPPLPPPPPPSTYTTTSYTLSRPRQSPDPPTYPPPGSPTDGPPAAQTYHVLPMPPLNSGSSLSSPPVYSSSPVELTADLLPGLEYEGLGTGLQRSSSRSTQAVAQLADGRLKKVTHVIRTYLAPQASQQSKVTSSSSSSGGGSSSNSQSSSAKPSVHESYADSLRVHVVQTDDQPSKEDSQRQSG